MQCNAEQAAEVIEHVIPSSPSVGRASSLQERLGLNERAFSSLVSGVSELLAYANSGGEGADAVTMERDAVSFAFGAIRPLFEAHLQQALETLDNHTKGEGDCFDCGGCAESQGRRFRPWESIVGSIRLGRRYRYCSVCDKGSHPSQAILGLPSGKFTARLEEVATMLSTTVAYPMAASILESLTGVVVSVKGLEQMIERRGSAVAQLLELDAAGFAPYDELGLPIQPRRRPGDAIEDRPQRAYLEVDGVLPMVREPVPHNELTPADKRRLTKAKKEKARGGKSRRWNISGREVKNAVLYRAEDCADLSPGRGSLLHKKYVSHLGTRTDFADLLWVELARQRFDQAKQLVVLSDGAAWIRNLCDWLPVPTFLILDLFHVKHRIWEVANALYGAGSTKAAAWAQTQCKRVEQGKADKVIQALRFEKGGNEVAREKLNELREYLNNNLDRMDYPKYRKRGLRVGSGAVESANYHVTGARMKLQGMRWSEIGATHMAYLRADLFNGNWERTTRDILAVA